MLKMMISVAQNRNVRLALAMFEDIPEDTLALYGVVCIVFGRVISEITRLRSLGPDFAAANDGVDARTPESSTDWLSPARELEQFTKDGARPRGKRLKVVGFMLAILSIPLVTAAYRVSVATRARVIRSDYREVQSRVDASAKRRAVVRVWIDDERHADNINAMELAIPGVEVEVIRPYSSSSSPISSCAVVDDPWSAALDKLSDEDIDVWIHDRVKNCPSSSYDVVFISRDGEVGEGNVVLGQNRAAWARFDKRSNPVFDVSVRALFAPLALQTQQIPPFLSTSDGVLLVSFSLVNAAPVKGYALTWDFERDVEQPFLGALPRALHRVLDTQIEGQVLRHAQSRIRPRWSERHQAFVVDAAQTPFFIDSDWPIDTSVNYTPVNGKPLHFAVYVPPQSECPLYILDENEQTSSMNGFIVEGWGGIVVFNPPGCALHGESQRELNREEISKLVNAFVQQLREHLGVAAIDVQKIKATILPPKESGFAAWEVDALVHTRMVSDSHSAISTLSSLDKVISDMPDMAVPQEIADLISESTQSLERAISLAQEMRYDEASASARQAHAVAEAAFFHPFSLDGLQAYPIEYKVAALIPILLPMLIPLLLTFMREAHHFSLRKSCAARAKRGKKD